MHNCKVNIKIKSLTSPTQLMRAVDEGKEQFQEVFAIDDEGHVDGYYHCMSQHLSEYVEDFNEGQCVLTDNGKSLNVNNILQFTFFINEHNCVQSNVEEVPPEE